MPLGFHGFVVWQFLVDPWYVGTVAMRPRFTWRGNLYFETCENGLVVTPGPFSSEESWGTDHPGQQGNSLLEVKVYTSAQSINWYISRAHGYERPGALT
jgi:hypothetical protein